jgi:hypothetical protein
MTQFQYFIPCTGGIDEHEHKVYCGCAMQGLGTEVFPNRMAWINANSVLDLDTNQVLMKVACEVIDSEIEIVCPCAYCKSDVIKTHTKYKTVQGEIKIFSPMYGECVVCGSI